MTGVVVFFKARYPSATGGEMWLINGVFCCLWEAFVRGVRTWVNLLRCYSLYDRSVSLTARLSGM